MGGWDLGRFDLRKSSGTVLYAQALAGETEAGPLSEGASVELCHPAPDRVSPVAMGTLPAQLERKAWLLCFTDGEIEIRALSKCVLRLWCPQSLSLL